MKKKEKPKDVKLKKEKFNAMEHWKGMPEFKQGDLKAFHAIKVNFETADDMHKFSKLVATGISKTTRSIWYPNKPWDLYNDKRYSDKK